MKLDEVSPVEAVDFITVYFFASSVGREPRSQEVGGGGQRIHFVSR